MKQSKGITKAVEYAYPSSDNAYRAGYPKEGNYSVTMWQGMKRLRNLGDFGPDRGAALRFAETFDYPYHKYSIQLDSSI